LSRRSQSPTSYRGYGSGDDPNSEHFLTRNESPSRRGSPVPAPSSRPGDRPGSKTSLSRVTMASNEPQFGDTGTFELPVRLSQSPESDTDQWEHVVDRVKRLQQLKKSLSPAMAPNWTASQAELEEIEE
jgi:hypothetical protein